MLRLKGTRFLDWDFTVLFSILHVADKDHDYIWLTLLNDLCMPSYQALERRPASDVVGEKHAVGTLVENLRDRLE